MRPIFIQMGPIKPFPPFSLVENLVGAGICG